MILTKMSAQTENISPNTVDPYEEVKKLQSLVQKLEHQNEQLLKNQINIVKEDKDIPSKERRSKSLGGMIIDNGINPKILNLSLDFETKKLNPNAEEFIDVDELQLSDDDSWLYTPPKGLSSEEMSLSPYKWLRKDLEDPKNKELQLAKSALVNKLEELSILSSPSQQDAEVQIIQNDKILSDISDTETSSEQPRVIDSRTFTRPKKKKNSKEEDSAKIMPVPEVRIEPAISNGENSDDYSPTYDFGYIRPELHQLSDFIDVHEKARMQEESLKQGTPVLVSRGSCSLPRPRKLSNCKLESPTGVVSDTEEMFANHADNGRMAICRPLTSTPTTQKSFSSTHSSLLGSNSSLSNAKVPSSLRRSLPNLARGNTNKRPSAKTANNSGLSIPHRYGLSSQQHHLQPPAQQTRRESAPIVVYRNSSLQEAHYPSSSTSVHNTQGLRKSSLPVSSRAQSRSALPRPSKLPTPKPKLPVPLHHLRKNVAEETWSDGCF